MDLLLFLFYTSKLQHCFSPPKGISEINVTVVQHLSNQPQELYLIHGLICNIELYLLMLCCKPVNKHTFGSKLMLLRTVLLATLKYAVKCVEPLDLFIGLFTSSVGIVLRQIGGALTEV